MRKLILVGGGLVALAVVAIAAFYAYEMFGSDNPDLATEAPAIDASAATNTPGSSAASAVRRFTIDSTQSSAKYVVKEDLHGVSDLTTVGTTSSITGDVYLTNQGLAPGYKSSFKVDMNTLKTDSDMRDTWIKRDPLEVSRFPTAEFSIDSIAGFPANYVENTEVTLTLSGTLTVHGVSRPATWQVKARQAGDTLTATADTDLKMSDHGMSPPNVGFAKAQDDVHVQIILVSRSVGV